MATPKAKIVYVVLPGSFWVALSRLAAMAGRDPEDYAADLLKDVIQDDALAHGEDVPQRDAA